MTVATWFSLSTNLSDLFQNNWGGGGGEWLIKELLAPYGSLSSNP